jgi:hypothetical protein
MDRHVAQYKKSQTTVTNNTSTSTIEEDPGLVFLLNEYYGNNRASFAADFESENPVYSNEDVVRQTRAMLKHVYGLQNKTPEEIAEIDSISEDELWKRVIGAGLHSKILSRYRKPEEKEDGEYVDDDPYYV